MNVTSYSILTAIACFNVFIAVFALVRRGSRVVLYCGMAPLVCLCVLSVARTVCAVEFSFTRVVTIGGVNWLYDVMKAAPRLLGKKITIGAAAFVLWAGWSAVELLQFAYRMFLTWRYGKRAVWVSDPEKLRLCRQITGGRVRLALTARQVPYVIGFFRPIVFLPAIPLSDHELRYILMHEWRHFQSKDQWKKAIVQVMVCLFWWNPFVYLLRFDLEQFLELQCDRKVLKLLPEEERVPYLKMVGGFCDVKLSSGREKDMLSSGMAPLKKRRALSPGFKLVKQRLWLGMRYGKSSFFQKVLSFVFCAVVILAFLASYMIILQPRYEPAQQDESWVYEFPEEAVLVENADGTYTIMLDGKEWSTVSDRTDGPFASMPVIPFKN